MAYRLAKTSSILQACAKLHNFVIDQQLLDKEQCSNNNEENVNDDDDEADGDILHIVAHAVAPSGM